MHQSGLALSGANLTLKLWDQGQEAASADNNGILTAEEVSTMDLRGTWLVSLSACDTGSGQARAGEGVMGLRRGFVQAGAQNLLMTLWHISDQVHSADHERFLCSCASERRRSGGFGGGPARVAGEASAKSKDWLKR